MYTDETQEGGYLVAKQHRGAGLAQQLVSDLARRLLSCGKLPIYVVAKDNLPSSRVAEKLGFVLDSRWGYLGSF